MANTQRTSRSERPTRAGVNTRNASTRTRGDASARTSGGANSASRSTRSSTRDQSTPQSSGSSPLIKFIVLPSLAAVAFVVLGVVVSCVGGFSVM